ncbi:MAG TPA: protein-tyrosine phosphatase family protein [Pseudonocardia sp.]|nr:protein-tyrosine phosphatase family protein [Pseudonocardia sp.]
MGEELVGSIALPDGTAVRGRGRREPLPPGPLPQFGLYLGRPPDRAGSRLALPRGTPWRPDWPAEWIDWPDFRTPRDDPAAAAAIVATYRRARAGERVEVACGGGVGRTGTVIACLAVLAGHPAEDAVGWTRRHYRSRAVETGGQRRWIAWFAEHVRDAHRTHPE